MVLSFSGFFFFSGLGFCSFLAFSYVFFAAGAGAGDGVFKSLASKSSMAFNEVVVVLVVVGGVVNGRIIGVKAAAGAMAARRTHLLNFMVNSNLLFRG
jgi:hypothetical protein